jgi:hypothetical protein
MALDPQITFVSEPDCSKVTITDTTVYGGAEPDRVDVKVNFTVTFHPSSGDVDLTPLYDELTVTELILQKPNDGWYEVDMVITDAVTDDELATLNKSYILLCNSNKCLMDKILKWSESFGCKCPDKELFACIQEIRTLIDAAKYKCSINIDLAGSRDLVECVEELCLCSNNDCDTC